MARKKTRRTIKQIRRTRNRRYKGGQGDDEDYSLSNIQSILKSKIAKKRTQDRFHRRAVTQNAKHKEMLQSAFQLNPPLSGVLKIECKNPDNCVALGRYGYALKKYFNNFSDLTLIDNAGLKRLGAPSANGFVVEVPFIKGGYKAYSALKCSSKEESDNLYYEFFVGTQFINTYITKLPCFVETFGCYNFNSESEWSQFKTCATTNSFVNIDLQNMITPFVNTGENSKQLFEKSCEKNKLICVLIQHFDNVKSFLHEYTHEYDNIKYDLYCLLYQVYFGLTQLGNTYTHYDLHPDNVLLYKPYDGRQYITMRYHSNGQIYEFKSEFISKIIDYGRNYIKLPNGDDTNNLLTGPDGICNLSKCQPYCGENVGYSTIQGTADDPSCDFYDIFPNIPNMSHDLRLGKNLIKMNINYLTKYGTPQNLTTGIGIINNIFDMRTELERLMGSIASPAFNAAKQIKKYDASWKQAAIMEIFDNGQDYTYTVTP